MNEPKPLGVKELFSSDSYVIPIYQRNFAWGETEIIQFIQDIVDYCRRDKLLVETAISPYYIGTLVVSERKLNGKTCFETIDGQQRLTTLSLMLSMIKNYPLEEYKKIDMTWCEQNLEFECRKNSNKTLEALFDDKSNNNEFNPEIMQGYEDVKKALPRILNEARLSIDDFCKYLFEQVIILRVSVPDDTDLNHYFEIMNSRGKQLEKHEILKANCLETLKDPDHQYTFNLIWEACSNMEKYIQYGFNEGQRNIIFGNEWNGKIISQEDIYTAPELKPVPEEISSGRKGVSIKELIKKSPKQDNEEKEKDGPERFNSIINFPNFLLHILRIQMGIDIPLDDKKLLESFNKYLLKNEDNQEFVKAFGYNLLKGKFLFDKYIIKREFTKDEHWSLRCLKWNETVSYVNTFGKDESNDGENEKNDKINIEIVMLLSMFHVSAPAPSYKHWLNGALKYLFENEDAEPEEYKNYLENLAKLFLHKKYLSSSPVEYDKIVYGDESITRIDNIKHTDDEISMLDKGTAVENFIFNYLDYLLWKNFRNGKEYYNIENEEPFKKDEYGKINNFRFTLRSSVEHYYPQNPRFDKELPEEVLNNFGNLCLISSSKNSELGNEPPSTKKKHYLKSESIDSVKQAIMMKYKSWDANEIEKHGKKMKELLLLSAHSD